jgi:hypothetical protein
MLFVFAIGLALLLAVPALGQPARTAQSGMITIESPSSPANFVITTGYTYQYNRTCAAGYISCSKVEKTWIGTESTPNSTCSGVPTTSVPTVDGPKTQAVISANDCNFWAGTPLVDTGSSLGNCGDFSNSTPNNTKESSRRTDFVCTIVQPTTPDPYGTNGTDGTPGESVLCWDSQSSSTGDATITPAGKVAGESVVCNQQHPLKYSFTLLDSLSTNGTRVSGLTVTLKSGTTVLKEWSEALSNLDVGPYMPGTDFSYTGSAGANGVVGLLTSKGATYNTSCTSEPADVNAIQGGSVFACGPVPTNCAMKDQFVGNNGVGGDRADYNATESYSLTGAGSYTLTVSGTIKSSVAGLANLPISVCANVTVNAQQCLSSSTTCP